MARPLPSTPRPAPAALRAGSADQRRAASAPRSWRARVERIAASPAALSLVLVLLVSLAFSPLLSAGFIDFDDDLYVTANPHVQAGLTWSGVHWAIHSTAASNWHPVTWLAHMLDCQLYGLRPWGHHLTSLMLHVANTVLVFVVLKRLTAALGASFLVAALFGVHPLHVESVAWVAERKDVLSTSFFLLTIAAYARYAKLVDARSHSHARPLARYHALTSYLLALVLFGLGLMTKPMLVSLPFVLLLLDFWPLQRWAFRRGIQDGGEPLTRLLLEKVPFLALAAISSAVTYLVQKQSGAVTMIANLTFPARLENALVSYCRYLGKMIWPTNLTVFYPFPNHWGAAIAGLAAVFLVAVTVLAVFSRRRYPWLLMGWAWFVITLGPVIGLVQAGAQAMADRYTYMPLLGIFIIAAWGLQALVSAPRVSTVPRTGENPPIIGAGVTGSILNSRALAWLPVPVLLLCAGLTYHQTAYWRTSEALWSHALIAAPNNFLAHVNLGLDFERQRRLDEAATQFRAAIQLRPAEAKPHANLANVLCRQGQVPEGIAEFDQAIRLDPNFTGARHNLAFALCRQGRLAEGIAQFEEILKLRPDSPQTHFDIAMALAAAGRKPEAISHLERTLQLRPGFPDAQRQLQTLRASPN